MESANGYVRIKREYGMGVFIFFDLHVGHPDANFSAISKAIEWASREAEEVWGCGDWFHLTEEGLQPILDHSLTGKLKELAKQKETKLIPGNHDIQLYQYQSQFAPIKICQPFIVDEILYCHGHEYDPVTMFPYWWHRLWARITYKKTPGVLRGGGVTLAYLIAVESIHSRAILDAKRKGLKGLVMGHTHLPRELKSPELPFLVNGGDMRDSLTFVIKEGNRFEIIGL